MIRFHKMHGLGNDFVVIDGVRQKITLPPSHVQRLADRHFGIGCDQLLIIEAAAEKNIDFYYRIYNADGTEVGQCGNGARCLARFVHDTGLTTKKQLRVKTRSTILTLHYQDADNITVDMGVPQAITRVTIGQQTGIYLSLGNPHVVFTTLQLAQQNIEIIGRRCQTHPLFPEGVNAGFMEIIDAQHILLRVYERGAGETWACGSGACAAAVAGIYQQQLISPVTVQLPYGELMIAWPAPDASVAMTGPATHVFSGEIAG